MSLSDHLSRPSVARWLKRPTWKHDGQPYRFRFGLASNGVYMCPFCYHNGGSLLHCLSTLTFTKKAVYFCCTGLGVTSTGRYPASCPVKPGLSSSVPFRLYSRDHLACSHGCYSNTKILLSKEKNLFALYTSKQLPPTNSLKRELCGISSLGTEIK